MSLSRPTPPRAVALISGGLDSMLAAKLMLEQGVHVEGINFYTGFCVEGHTQAIRSTPQHRPKRNNALWTAEQLGIKLHIVDVVEPYKDIVLNPKHGYGAHLNPCLDCKGFMVGQAREWMEQHGFDFIITGEVMNQRPMSQRKDLLPVVARESGANDRLLRPLSAKLLAPTLPEREGWVDRDKLLGLSGRGRKPQMQLAAAFGISDYAQPAGGCCFLTDPNYERRLTDLWATRGEKRYELDDIILLKVGRHLRPSPEFKLIVARDEGETNFLLGYRHRFVSLETVDFPGPLVFLEGESSEANLLLAARLTARFGKARGAQDVRVSVTLPRREPHTLTVTPLDESDIPTAWYL